MTNQIVKALEEGAQKIGKTLAEDAGKAVKDLYHSAGDNLKKVAHNTREADRHHEGELKRILGGGSKNGPHGPGTPRSPHGPAGEGGKKKYFIHDDGRVQELRNGKLHDLDPKDGSGIHTLLDSSKKDHVKDPTEKDMRSTYHARKNKKNPSEKVSSEKIDSPTELSHAVEEARRAKGDYGGTNYASLHYKDADGKEFVLVGQSGDLRSHSERSIGKPLLGGREGNVQELYTERAPCQKDANCERWLARHFEPHNDDMKVSHGVDYNSSLPKEERDWGHKAYLDQLKQDHAAGSHGGTMGSHDFDAKGQENMEAAEARRQERAAKRARKGL
ncbi:nucleic acid/nucleotide deaminase domain-containing protein [Kitasatospora cinereorecta]|uniref:Nucleic acid/nucleotide deaminase domain-containing protein n=1 Tax=Kitasatospora cinereorecta TaxID=285560 RepID=A0ABW0V5U3_9ACTN